MTVEEKALLNEIPGKMGLLYFGEIFSFLINPIKLLEKKQAAYGNIFKYRYLGMPVVNVLAESFNQFLLVDNHDNVSSKQAWDLSIGELFPNGLMLMDGEQHKHHRSIIHSAFTKKPMNGYLELMQPTIIPIIESWKDIKNFKAFPEVKELTLKTAGKVFYGLDFSDDLKKVNEALIDIVSAATSLPFAIPFTPYWKGLKARKYLVEYFTALIIEKRANPTKDLFSKLCTAENEDGEQLTNQEIIDHLIFILMAAHDTTASAVTSMLYLLGKHPEWQEKVRAEIMANPDIDTTKDLRQWTSISMVIKETLRLYPPLITIPRKTVRPLKYQQYTIPKGVVVSVALLHNHTTGKHWTEPEKFDPLRFDYSRKEHQKCPHAYAPFGAGRHHCIGYAFAEMEIKLIMKEILMRYKWSFEEGYECAYQRIPLQMPKDGLPIQFETLHH